MSNSRNKSSKIYVGEHIPKLQSYSKTVEYILSLNNRSAFQIFVKNRINVYPLSAAKLNKSDILKTSDLLESNDIRCVIHAAYIYNLCGAVDPSNIEHSNLMIDRTVKGLTSELDMGVALGNENYTPKVVIHMGSCKDRELGIKNAVLTINKLGTEDSTLTEKVMEFKDISKKELKSRRQICIENSSGEGNKFWRTIEEAHKIYNHPLLNSKVKKNNLSFCIDTAHLYGMGEYDFGKETSIDLFFRKWKGIPLSKVGVIHLNDSSAIFGSHLDRHALVGKGRIFDREARESGLALEKIIKLVLPDGSLKGVPLILETPEQADPAIEWLQTILFNSSSGPLQALPGRISSSRIRR